MKYKAILFFLLSLASVTDAQISIQTADFFFYLHIKNTVQPIIAGYTIENPSTLGKLVSAGDTNQTWDLSKVTFTKQPQAGFDSVIAYPGNAPLASDQDFASSTLIVVDTNSDLPKTYSFLYFSSDGIYNLGMTQDSMGIATKISGWNPPLKEQSVPVKFGGSWVNTSHFSGASLKAGETLTVTTQANVDGWGTLILPKFLPYPALRVKKQIITTNTKDGLTTSIDTSFEYDFLSYMTSTAKIITNSRNEILSAEYTTDAPKAAVSTSQSADGDFILTDNPASTTGTKMTYTLKNESQVKIEVIDMLGNSIRILQNERASAGQHVLAIDPGVLNNGAYFIRLTSPETTSMKKLIIAR